MRFILSTLLLASTLSASAQFKAHVIEKYPNGVVSAQIDTLTGYRKYFSKDGKIEMEGKVTADYRDGLWKYYSVDGFLDRQETYSKNGKLDSRQYSYFKNGNKMSEIFEYFEGIPKTEGFKFHKLEKLFYLNGSLLAERHFINNKLVDSKCWDRKGKEQPLSYLETIKSLDPK